jgi:hypothetical protein
MKLFGIRDNLARLVNATMENDRCQVKMQGGMLYLLEVMNGYNKEVP